MGCPFLPTPDLGRKKSLFFASVPRFWACCPHVFSFSFTSILCFSSWILHIFPFFFVKFSAWANANWQISGVICCVSDDHPMQISHNFPTCTVEITQHTLLSGWNYTIHPPVLLKLPNTPSCTVDIILHALLSGWNYPAHPPVRLKLSCTPFCMV